MIDFMKVAKDSYVLYVNGVRVTDVPLTKEELTDKIGDIQLSEDDIVFIERFYGGEKIGE